MNTNNEKVTNVSTINTIDGVDCYEKDGTVYLKLETVARGLGFTTTQTINGTDYMNIRWNTVKQYLFDIGFLQEVAKKEFSPRTARNMFIPENVFYRLAMKAKNETAEKFQAKVADEIIPTIRKTGGYVATAAVQPNYKLPMNYHEALVQLVEQVEINEKLTEENKVLTPKAEYCDTVLNKPDLIPIGTIARDLSMTPQKLNGIMKENGIIFKSSSGTWHPYRDYEWLIKKGYADYRSYTQEKAKPQLQWTEKGRKWIIKNIKKWKKNLVA